VISQGRAIILVDLIFPGISLVCGTIACTSLVNYIVDSIRTGAPASLTIPWIIATLILLGITIYSFRKIESPPIRMLVIILVFVPQIVYLLLDQTIPFPDVWFMKE
jgi:uncharacterized membrane protein YoaK (UPF0700 family)